MPSAKENKDVLLYASGVYSIRNLTSLRVKEGHLKKMTFKLRLKDEQQSVKERWDENVPGKGN